MKRKRSSSDTIRIPSSSKHLYLIDEFLESWLRDKDVSEDMVADLAISVTELVNNAIEHGNGGDPSKKVTLKLDYGNHTVTASVTDEGCGFNPDGIPDPTARENLLKEVGRGIFIVRSLMDEVKFDFSHRGETTVTISKKIT